MNIFTLFTNQSPAEPWIEKMLERESKITGEPLTLVSPLTQDIVSEQTIQNTKPVTQTVCTSQSLNHSEEENQKIKLVHDELANLIFKPALAF